MPLFACCLSSSVRPKAVIQPHQQKAQHYATTSSAIGSTTNKEAQLAEYAASLRSHQTTKESVCNIQAITEPKTYWSNEINLSKAEAEFLANVSKDIFNTIFLMTKIKEQPAFPKDFFNKLKKEIHEHLQAAKQLQHDSSLMINNLSTLQCIDQLCSNPEKLTTLTDNPDAYFFCEDDNFSTAIVAFFNERCYRIPFNTHLNDLKSTTPILKYTDRGCLSDLTSHYAQKEILKNQLPTLKKKLVEIKKKQTLDKTYIAMLEHAMRSTENCIRNMEQPQRAAIMDAIAPKARPTHNKDFLRDKDCLAVMFGSPIVDNMSDEEVEDIYQKLKAIPFEVV